MPSVHINYFALLREKANKDSEVLSFEGTYQDLYQHLAEKYHFDLSPEFIQVAINDEFSVMSETIKENEKVVFIPPVAGG